MHSYFAYGSNMDQDQMRERCPGAVLIGPAVLPGYRLGFTIFSPKRLCGCADVISSPSDSVHGLLYRLTDAEMEAMDAFEGHPIHYCRIPIRVQGPTGEIEAETYEVADKREGLSPSAHYLGLMRSAAERFAFPRDYQTLLRETKTCE